MRCHRKMLITVKEGVDEMRHFGYMFDTKMFVEASLKMFGKRTN